MTKTHLWLPLLSNKIAVHRSELVCDDDWWKCSIAIVLCTSLPQQPAKKTKKTFLSYHLWLSDIDFYRFVKRTEITTLTITLIFNCCKETRVTNTMAISGCLATDKSFWPSCRDGFSQDVWTQNQVTDSVDKEQFLKFMRDRQLLQLFWWCESFQYNKYDHFFELFCLPIETFVFAQNGCVSYW